MSSEVFKVTRTHYDEVKIVTEDGDTSLTVSELEPEILAQLDGDLEGFFLGFTDGTKVVLEQRTSDQDW